MCWRCNLFEKSNRKCAFREEGYVSTLMTISEGRSFVLLGDAVIVEEMSVWVVDARRGVGRDVNGMGMFCSRENERVLCGSGGAGVGNVDSRVIWGGDGEKTVGGEGEDVLR